MAKNEDIFCDVCESDRPPFDKSHVNICTWCIHPKRVRVYYQCCGSRLDLSLQEARKLFAKAGVMIWRTGIVIRFDKCPKCSDGNGIPPICFTGDYMDSEREIHCSAACA